jgi:hypothetical protein
MSQIQIELTNHIGFQLSLLRLSTIPGPKGDAIKGDVAQQAEQLAALADRVHRPAGR